MQLHNVKRKNSNKAKRTRVGRGGKRGTTSGKGTKGQKSRAGRKMRPAIRDLVQRLPKMRGYDNKPLSAGNSVVNLNDLEKVKGEVTLRSLKEAGVINVAAKSAKVLANGEITKAVVISAIIKVSAEAKKKIEAAGGKIGSAPSA